MVQRLLVIDWRVINSDFAAAWRCSNLGLMVLRHGVMSFWFSLNGGGAIRRGGEDRRSGDDGGGATQGAGWFRI